MAENTAKLQIQKPSSIQQPDKSEKGHKKTSLHQFGWMLLIIQIILIVLLWVFAKDSLVNINDHLFSQRYPAYQDINVMMLIGFAFLMTFMRSYAWSSIAYTFFLNAYIFQMYILLQTFWDEVWSGNWASNGFSISVDITTMIACSYAVGSVLIAFGGVIGRVGPKDLLIMMTFHIIGYALNQKLVFKSIGMVDAGGSSTIHTYGAYFGLTVCMMLSKVAKPLGSANTSYISNITAFIGTIFLWMYWPSFNFGLDATNEFEESLIVINTIMSLTGSVLGTFIICSLCFGEEMEMESILNATLAGGVAIGASSQFVYRPGVALFIGCSAGMISTLCFHYLSPKLTKLIGLYDTCGIHNLHGIPGLMGGIWSSIIIAFYSTGYDANIASQFSNGNFQVPTDVSFQKQALLQLGGTFCSMGMGIIMGIFGGLVINCFYSERPQAFYQDREYFENAGHTDWYGEEIVVEESKERTIDVNQRVAKERINLDESNNDLNEKKGQQRKAVQIELQPKA